MKNSQHILSLNFVRAILALQFLLNISSILASSEDWQLERLFLPDRGVFEGDEVLSMDLDIDGDGVIERLIALRGDMASKQGQIWRVFDNYEGRFKILGSMSFRADACGVLEKDEGDLRAGLYAYYPGSSESGSLVSFKVVGGKVVTEKIRDIFPKGADKELYKRLMSHKPEYRSYSAEQLYLDYPNPDVVAHVYIPEGDSIGKTRPKPRHRRKRISTPSKDIGSEDDRISNEKNSLSRVSWLVFAAVFCACGLFLVYRKKFKPL